MNSPDVATLKARQQVRNLARPRQPKVERFSPPRWPYTYAADLIRARGLAESRGEAAVYHRLLADEAGLPREFVAELLAEAYIVENNIIREEHPWSASES